MTSRQDSPPITIVDQYELIVSLQSFFSSIAFRRPPANINANLQDFPDIVATQGAYLVPRTGTPVLEKPYNIEFVKRLNMYLDVLVMRQGWRRSIYRSDADEWPIGRTPPELKERRKAELKAMEELWDITSDDSSANNEDKDEGVNGIRDDKKRTGAALAQPRTSRQTGGLPSPSLSAEISLATPYSRKRRRISEEDDEEKEDHARKNVKFAKEASASAEDAEARKERNARIITNRPSSVWKERLRPRARPRKSAA